MALLSVSRPSHLPVGVEFPCEGDYSAVTAAVEVAFLQIGRPRCEA